MQERIKPGYKQTEIGVIPENWEPRTLASLVDEKAPIRYGVVQIGADVPNGVPIVPIKYIKEISTARLHRAAISIESRYAGSRVIGGDVLLSVKGTIGRVGVAPNGFKGNIAREIARLRPSAGVVSKFLAYQLEARQTQKRILDAVVGTTRLEFSIAAVRNFLIPFPTTLAEQKLISELLSDADALIASLDALIAKKRDLKQAAMQQLLTGKTRLPGFSVESRYKQTEIGEIPADWNLARIVDVASITTGSRNTQDRIDDGAFPFFVRSQTVERINSYSFDGEAVLTAGDGVGTGKIFHYINEKFDLHQRVYKISNFSDRLVGYYFYIYFSNKFYDRIMAMTAKSSVDSVRREMIANMLVPLPTPDEQRAIAAVLSDMDAELITLEAKRNKSGAVKQGMMQELLTGRIRLI